MRQVTSDLLQDYLDNRLDRAGAEHVEHAVDDDPALSAELERMRENAQLLRSHQVEDLPEEWMATLRKIDSPTYNMD